MKTDNNDKIHSKYWHIDNGGFDFSVDGYGSVKLSFGFHGYSDTTVFLTANKDFSVEALAAFFTEASFKLKQHHLENVE